MDKTGRIGRVAGIALLALRVDSVWPWAMIAVGAYGWFYTSVVAYFDARTDAAMRDRLQAAIRTAGRIRLIGAGFGLYAPVLLMLIAVAKNSFDDATLDALTGATIFFMVIGVIIVSAARVTALVGLGRHVTDAITKK